MRNHSFFSLSDWWNILCGCNALYIPPGTFKLLATDQVMVLHHQPPNKSSQTFKDKRTLTEKLLVNRISYTSVEFKSDFMAVLHFCNLFSLSKEGVNLAFRYQCWNLEFEWDVYCRCLCWCSLAVRRTGHMGKRSQTTRTSPDFVQSWSCYSSCSLLCPACFSWSWPWSGGSTRPYHPLLL